MDNFAIEILRELQWKTLRTNRRLLLGDIWFRTLNQLNHGWKSSSYSSQTSHQTCEATARTDMWHLLSKRSGQVVLRLLGLLVATQR